MSLLEIKSNQKRSTYWLGLDHIVCIMLYHMLVSLYSGFPKLCFFCGGIWHTHTHTHTHSSPTQTSIGRDTFWTNQDLWLFPQQCRKRKRRDVAPTSPSNGVSESTTITSPAIIIRAENGKSLWKQNESL